MSLFEWLCESGNMGPVGSVTGSRGAVRRSNGAVLCALPSPLWRSAIWVIYFL